MSLNWKNNFLKKMNGDHFTPQELSVPGNFYWKNCQGQYVDCNSGLLDALQLKAEDFIGKTDEDLWPEQAEIIMQDDNEVIEHKLSTVEEQILSSDSEDDSECKVFLIARIPWLDKKGEVIGTIGNLTDITNRNRKELALQRKNRSIALHFENIMDALPINLYWKDSSGVYLGCNSLMASTAHLHSKVDIIGKTDKLLWPKDEQAIRQSDNQVLQTRRIINVQEAIEGKPYFSSKAPFHDEEGEILGVVGILVSATHFQDLSIQPKEGKLTKTLVTHQAMETASQAKSAFLENVRYDMRLPLASIMGISELLSRDLNKNEAKKYALGLVETSKELLRLLNETLEITHISSEEMPLIKKPFDLKEVLENVVKLHSLTALEKELSLEFKFDEAIPSSLIGDPVRIYRIVLELLANSLKFTEEGSINVTAKMGRIDSQDVVIQIFVEDTGIGIPEEKQQALFIRFKQPSLVSQNRIEEHGLGLSVVKQFIDDINGEIYVDSCLNQGTKFVCVVPLKKPLLNKPFTNFSHSAQSSSPFGPLAPSTAIKNQFPSRPFKKCVLVVEDFSIASLIAKTLFSEQGCDVDIAENGATALERIEQHQYNFILLDIGLPDMNGYEVARKIRSFEKAAGRRRTFIVGLSCHAEDKKKQMALDAGMNIVLTKPLTQEIASSLLENVISSPCENKVDNKKVMERQY